MERIISPKNERIWVDERFKKQIKIIADSQQKSILEVTRDMANTENELKAEMERLRKNAKMFL